MSGADWLLLGVYPLAIAALAAAAAWLLERDFGGGRPHNSRE